MPPLTPASFPADSWSVADRDWRLDRADTVPPAPLDPGPHWDRLELALAAQPEPCSVARVVAVRAGMPACDSRAAGDYLVYTGNWVAAVWGRHTREGGWHFACPRTGQPIRPTHYVARPAHPPGAFGDADRFDRALPSGLALAVAGNVLGSPGRVAAQLAGMIGALRAGQGGVDADGGVRCGEGEGI